MKVRVQQQLERIQNNIGAIQGDNEQLKQRLEKMSHDINKK